MSGEQSESHVGDVAAVTGLGIDAAMGGQSMATAEAVLAGETTLATGAEITAAGAAGAGAAAAAGVIGAGLAGYGVGQLIEQETGIGSASGDWVYDHSDPQASQDALHHSEAASDAWDQGNYGTAAVEGAETLGSMAEGLVTGLFGGDTNADQGT